ncbi:MAG: serine hydrolase [Candidatus Eremiobacteraeota bacterium]|nr:serine hydrolase [Candidatus Eremiobacteraeota bacterium]
MLAAIAPLVAAISLQAALDARAGGAAGTGIAVGVIDHGAAKIYVAGNAGNGRPVDERTLFEIGSVTKTFTATALAVMTLHGDVTLNDPISKYLPPGVRAPSRNGRAITLLDLAEQRSGLPRLPTNMDDVGGDDPYADYTNADMYAFLNGYTLTRDPGASYEYSNYGVGLLGQLLANRMQTTYPQLVQNLVLAPLGMHQTGVMMTNEPDPALLAVGHDLSGAVVATWHAQSIAPAGQIASNLDDMLKYLRCNMGHGPLARACLFAQQPRAQGPPEHRIGLIWNVNSQTGNISHSGDTYGFHAFVAISRDRQTGVVALSNGPAVDDIAVHVMAPSYPIAGCPSSVPTSETDPSSYAGVYCNRSGGMTFSIRTATKPDELSIALLPQPAQNVLRVATDTFYAAQYGASFVFIRDRGQIIGLWLMQYGELIPAVRLGSHGDPLVTQLASPFPSTIPLDAARLEQYVGTYTAQGLGAFTVTLRDRALYVQLTGQAAVPVYASAIDQFFYKIVDAQIEFNRDAAGRITSLTLHQNGQTITAARAKP